MAVDLAEAMRRVQWNANKRSADPSPRIPEDLLTRLRTLHAQGAYEAAIEALLKESSWETDPLSWRLIGLCALGLRRYSEARSAFSEARRLNTFEIVKDEVNAAATFLSENAYDEAERVAKRAHTLAPSLASPVICLLSIYNRAQRFDDLKYLIETVNVTQPNILSDSDFLERVANDTDLIGVGAIVAATQRP
jgi:tetratricopeptide (TPR) repeat protein